MKKIWLLLSGLLFLAAAVAQAQFTYTTNSGTITITGYTGSGAVTVPGAINGLPVTSIGPWAFWDCSSLTSVTIPNSVTSIAAFAFFECTSLTNATIDNSVTNIGDNAFDDCISLTNVSIPNSVTSIGDSAFVECISLTNVSIPSSVTSVGGSAFGDCTSLSSVYFEGNAPTVVSNIFEYDNNATVYYWLGTTGWSSPFAGCPADAQNPFSYMTNAGGTTITLTNYSGPGGFVVIPTNINGLTVTSIATNAFANLTSLTNVVIPGSVTNIGNDAFNGSTNLAIVFFDGNAPTVGSAVFAGDTNATVYYLPGTTGWSNPFAGLSAWQTTPQTQFNYETIDGSIEITGYTGSGGAVFIPPTINGLLVTSIGTEAFGTNLTSVTIPNSVNSIGEEAFNHCTGLNNVTIGNSVTSIEYETFFSCTSLTNVTIGNSVTNIGEDAFYGCTNLTSVTIPNSVTSIENWAFSACSSLTNVTIPNSVTSIDIGAFMYCSSLSNVTIGNSVTSIGWEAFSYCGLTSVTIPNSVTNIDYITFGNCRYLTNVSIGTGVSSIDTAAFSNCLSLAAITVDSNNYSYSSLNGVLFNKSQTTLITFPEGLAGSYEMPGTVTAIADYAFCNCGNLTSLTIPNSVTNIGQGALADCNNLTDLYFMGNAPSVDSSSFSSDNNATVYYLSGTTGWGWTLGGLQVALWYAPTGFTDADWSGEFQIPGACESYQVYVTAVDKNGNLYVAGRGMSQVGSTLVNGIAEWNGHGWLTLAMGVTIDMGAYIGDVETMACDNYGNLYAGGYFTAAGGVSVNNIAKWDGSTWSALGSGLGGWVYSLVCDNVGNLYACGTFTNAGSLNITNIAKWNGNAWSALGLGIGAGDPNSFINSLACDNFGNIYAGGTFTNAGGVMASNVAKWNGSAWSALGSGISGSQYGTGVTSLACDSSGILYVSGSFSTAGGVAANNIAKWNGSAWSALGSGFGGEYANSLVCDNSGNLYAGGWFTTAGEVSANYIAEWNGSVWSALGSGASVSFDGVNLDVTSLSCDSSGNLYVGGDFSYAGGLRVNSVAKWNGNAWSAIGQGCGDVYGGDYSVTEALARDISGNIYAGGDFATDGGVTVNGIAEWNGTTWTPLSSGVGGYEEPWVAAIAFDSSGNLYAGGCFTTAGGIPANNIAEWNGTTWLALGAGVSGEGIYTSVKALAFDSVGNLYAGGDFTNAGGVSANFIAKWNGSVWTSLGSGLIGQGFAYNGVNALVFDISGNLYAGGNFTNAGGVPANNIAKWNGNTWSTLGAGISGVPLYSEVNTEVNTLVFDSSGNLYVGGYFTNAGGVPANNIAKWNGNTWSPLWSGMNGTVSSLAFDNSGDLYATGAFTTAGGVPANGIAKWNGSAWIALGSGIGGSVNVPSGYSLAFDRSGNLYVGGGFTTAGTNGASDFTEALLTNVQIQTGSLQVIITPSTAITNGAHWQVDGGTLQSSGTTISGLAPGTHVLTFSTISGWVTPSGQTVAVSTNSTATACGNYVAIPQVGSLQVTIIPTAAVASGAQWQVDGGTLQNSGATVSNLSVGGHNVCFSTISSWTAPPCQTVTITSNSIATATGAYVTNYTLIVSASPANGGIVSSGGTFASNTTITVTATNNSGYVFTGWTSNGIPAVSTTNYTFTLRTNITLVANFLPCFTVMVSASPANGGTVNGGGTFASNSTITVTATNNSGYAFTGWTSNGLPAASTTNYTFTLRTNVTLVANFLPRFTVAVSASPANGGTVNGGGTFASNSTVTVTATASPGYVFTNWMQGTNVAATSTNYSFVLTSNATLLANFVATPPHIVLLNGTNVITNGETSPVNFGSVQLNRTGPIVTFVVTNTGGQTLNLEDIEVPAGYTLNTNYPAEIAALSNGTFSVQLVTTNVGVYCGNIDITNNDPITNTFSFSVTGMVTPVPSATVSVIASPADGGTASAGGTNGGGVFPVGTTNAVLATPNSGFEFIGWTGNATGTENPLMVTVNTNLNITANFAIITNFTLTVITNGEGTVSPNPNGRFFKANSTHILTATAASGYVFSNWTGSIATNKNPLTIKLESSIVLQANFTPNPFLPVTGTYNGLFSATNGVTEQTAGMLRGLTISKKGAYTGTLLINGGSHPISGAFNLDGQATNRISRTTAQGGLLTVVLSLTDGPPPQVTGTVSNAAWVSTNLIADRATNNPGALPSTEYTMLIPPDTKTAPTNSPGGYGYALITNHVGTVKITGALADGTAFSQSVPVSLDGYVPVYANLYSSKGLLLGWINLDLTNNDGVGLTWVHPETRSGLYVKGFTNILLTNQILLSPWTNSSTNIFAATNLSILDTINDTNALMDFTVTISNDYKLGEVAGPAPLSGCCINPKTGLLKVTIGSGVNQMTGYGAFLLNETNGCGYFLGKSNAGAVILDP